MANKTNDEFTDEQDNGMLTITREFDAPRQLVFETFIDPKHVLNWMGPREHPATHFEADVRPGGAWRGSLRGNPGECDERNCGVFREVVPPERLVYTFAWYDDDGPGRETLITVTFAEQGSKTLMTFCQGPFDTKANFEGHKDGWNSAFDRLVEYFETIRGTARVIA